MRTENTQPSWSTRGKLCVLIALTLVLLTGAVMSTASAAQLSFEAGQLQQEQYQLQARRQLLQERLAQQQSLQAVRQYAEEQGFSQPVQPVAQLDIVPELAQRNQ